MLHPQIFVSVYIEIFIFYLLSDNEKSSFLCVIRCTQVYGDRFHEFFGEIGTSEQLEELKILTVWIRISV